MMKVVDEADEKDKRDNNLEAMSSRKKNQGNHGNYNLNDHEFSVNNKESDPLYNNEKRDQDTIETKRNNSEPVLDNDDESCPLDTQNGNKNNNSNSINVVIENIGRKMLYKISDRPSIQSSIFFAFQVRFISRKSLLYSSVLHQVFCLLSTRHTVSLIFFVRMVFLFVWFLLLLFFVCL
jgi:hypothetical protein